MNLVSLKDYNRIIIIGSPGSGKSWLSKQIAALSNYPLIHLDNEFWKPDWVETPRPEWIEKQEQLIKGDKWIIDGNYNGTMEIRFAATDLVIFLDINRFRCVRSMLRRNRRKRTDLPNYLEEPKLFSKELFKFLKFIWKFPKTGKKTIMELHSKYPEKTFIHIRSRRQSKRLLGVQKKEKNKCSVWS